MHDDEDDYVEERRVGDPRRQGGKLQQLWEITQYHDRRPGPIRTEWRDVPDEKNK